MTNLIAKVAELRELAGRRQAIIDRQKESVNHALLERLEIESDLLNAAPRLLAALGKVQAGDAHTLDIIATFFEIPKRGMSDASYQKDLEWAGCLRRYADLGRMMEGNL